MDDAHLKKILQQHDGKPVDENARKRAVNLAVSEFGAYQKEKQKNFQGNGFFARLTGITNKDKRKTPMKNKKYIYGGMATAMAVVLAVGLTQTPELIRTMNASGGSAAKETNLISVDNSADGEVTQVMRQAIEERNMQREEEARRTGQSAMPTPSGAPVNRLELPPADAEADSMPSRVAKAELKPQELAEKRAVIRSEDFAGAPIASSPAPILMDRDVMPEPEYKDVGRDDFENFEENAIKLVSAEPVSTFSVDVDTSSYSFMRRQLENGVLPQKDAIRIEELINYFDYNYQLPETREQPFKGNVMVTPSPWAEGRKLIHIGVKGFDIEAAEKPRSNLVFLLDVSGSMNAQDKLPLLKNSMKLLLDTLGEDDTVAIAVYAGASGTVLEPTKVSDKQKIFAALDNLSAGGGTAGAAGLKLAYQLAESNFDKDAVNRVILATDGDFNVGITDRDELQDFVERKRESGIFLSVLGFGQGNYNDHTMQTLAQNGNGVAAYIDSLSEARKVLVEEASSTLFPIAKDVKIQVEFNPATVAEYRLIGYETRKLNREDFNNDAVDAGDIGAGHTVTAIYEITPVGGNRAVDDSRYNTSTSIEKTTMDNDFGQEYAFLKMRYKLPNEDTSQLITTPISTENEVMGMNDVECGPTERCAAWASDDVQFSTAVAAFGQLLKGGKYIGDFDYDDVIALAQEGKGQDEFGYRAEFVQLVRLAKSADAME